MFVTNKGEITCFITKSICIPMICDLMISLCVFGLVNLTVACRYSRMTVNIYCYKPQTHSFPHPLTANKSSCQPLAALQNMDPFANRKLYTCAP